MSSWVVTVFGFNLLMATRARWVERIFGGLDKMYVVHRRSGMAAGVLLLLHFAMVPRHPEFTIGKPMGFAALVLILLGVVFAAAPPMKRKIPYHKWVGGHRLLGAVFIVGVAHALFVPTLISQLPLVRVYVFGMAFLGCASWVYRVFLFRFFHPWLAYTVTYVREWGQSMVEIRMAPEGRRLEHDAGQFAFFKFADHSPTESHPFTIASAPAERELRIVVKALGDFTSELAGEVRTGDAVRVEGPYGHLTDKHCKSDAQVWLAGGIGITPFLARAQALNGRAGNVKLFWSVQSPEEAHYDEELAAIAAGNSHFNYVLWNSNERGFLSVASAGGRDALEGKEVVVCGPVAMRDSLSTQLRANGIKPGRIHYEEFRFR
jgi:predicted ferric reductase